MRELLFLALKNLQRQKSRSLLTILGISIGIATIVALSALSQGAMASMERALQSNDFDFIVAKKGSADLILSYLKPKQVAKIKKTPGVDAIAEVLYWMAPVEKNPYFLLQGINRRGMKLALGEPSRGRWPQKDDEIMLGKLAAENLSLEVGDMLKIKEKNYRIVGIFATGVAFQDNGAVVLLKTAQQAQDLTETVNLVGVKVASGFSVNEVAEKIEQDLEGEVVAIVNLEDFESIDQGLKITQGFSWAISFLAVIIGAIGVMNTMIMSVWERVREIGILRALGWSRKEVILMILAEALWLGIAATITGSLLGLGATELLMQVPMISAFLQPLFNLSIFIQAAVVAGGVTLLGSLYPALKAAGFSPLEALRYE